MVPIEWGRRKQSEEDREKEHFRLVQHTAALKFFVPLFITRNDLKPKKPHVVYPVLSDHAPCQRHILDKTPKKGKMREKSG